MAEVSNIVLKYTARGAKTTQRADRGVCDSIKNTAKTARKESGVVERWMQRHKSAILGIAAATTGAMAAIISASPTLSAQLAGVRLGFSLLAMEIGEDVAPATEGLAERVIDLADWYAELSDSIRKPISAFVMTSGAVGAVLIAFAALESLIAGTLVAKGLALLSGALVTVGSYLLTLASGAIFGTLIPALSAAVTAVVGVIAGISLLTAAIAIVVAAVVAFAAAYIFNIGGMRDKTNEVFARIWKVVTGAFNRILSAGKAAFSQLHDGVTKRIDSLRDGVATRINATRETIGRAVIAAKERAFTAFDTMRSGAITRISQLRDGVSQIFGSLILTARTWGGDLITSLRDGVTDRISRLVAAFRDAGNAAAQALRDTFNRNLPTSITLPQRRISIPQVLGGGSVTIGGGRLRLPQLDTGGLIESDGLYVGHAGERVLNPAETRQLQEFDGNANGGQEIDITIEQGAIQVHSQGTEVDMNQLVRQLRRELGDEFGRRS